MLKKIISSMLAMIIALSLAVPAFAANSYKENFEAITDEILTNVDTTKDAVGRIGELAQTAVKKLQPVVLEFVLDTDNWAAASEYMFKIIAKLFDKINNPDEPSAPSEPSEPSEPGSPDTPDVPDVPSITDIITNMSLQDFVNFMKKYYIINLNDIDETSSDIVDLAEYKYVMIEDGVETVYIVVNIEENPQLLNRDLLMETVMKLYGKQNDEYADDADKLMSYEHIAGELALHAIIYAVTNEYLEITGETEGTIYNLWLRAKNADLNIDENRIPSEIIEILGIFIMSVFVIDFYTIFKIAKGM